MEIATSIQPSQRYVVWSASITYNSTVYNVGDEFYGVDGVTTYTGSGYASEIIELQSASIETVTEIGDLRFPEQLSFNAASIEIVQPINGTIFPEQLKLHSASIEVGSALQEDVRIINF